MANRNQRGPEGIGPVTGKGLGDCISENRSCGDNNNQWRNRLRDGSCQQRQMDGNTQDIRGGGRGQGRGMRRCQGKGGR